MTTVREFLVDNEADKEEGIGTNEMARRRERRRDAIAKTDPRPATEGGTNGITSRDRRRREVQSVTNPASTRGRQGDNLCGACFVLF